MVHLESIKAEQDGDWTDAGGRSLAASVVAILKCVQAAVCDHDNTFEVLRMVM